MASRSRRAVLTLAGASIATGLAGCVDEDDEPEFLVTNAIVAGTTPQGGVRARVTIENEWSDRQTGTLVVNLEHDPPDGEARTYAKREELSVGRGSSPRYEYVFEGVYDPSYDISDFSATAEISDIEPA